MIDFFKFRNKLNEEHGAGDEGTPSLVAKYKKGTPGQSSPAPSRQPARKGDKLNAKMDYAKKISQDDITIKNTMSEAKKNDYKVYHKSYSDAVQHAVNHVSDNMGLDVDEDDYFSKVASGPRKPSSGKTNSFNIDLIDSKTGKPSRKRLHMQIYNMDNKGYELNMYVENHSPNAGHLFSEAKKMKGEDPCWKGYEMVGMKKKNGKEVPNCVPKESVEEDYDLEEMAGANMSTREIHAYLKKLGWEHVRSSGSHDVYKHPNSPDNIAVPKHKKIKPPTILGILKMAKKVKNKVDEKLDPSQGAGEYVKDFQKSDAPQFKGKSKKERQKMAVAAYLDAKRGN